MPKFTRRFLGGPYRVPASGYTSLLFLLLLLSLVLIRGAAYAVLNPAFASPDEREHFQYIAYLATGGESGPAGTERNQPMLYYVLMAPVYWATAGASISAQLLAIRLFSILFVVVTVVFTWLSARRLAPGKSPVHFVAAGIVALHPMNGVIGASANNDNAATATSAVLVFVVVSVLLDPRRPGATLAALPVLAAAVISKGSTLPIVVLSAITLIIAVGLRDRRRTLLLSLLGVVVLGALTVFTIFTPQGAVLMMRISRTISTVGQLSETSRVLAQVGPEAVQYQFVSFWSVFLGESLHPSEPWYYAPALIVGLAPLGYLVGTVRKAGMSRRAVFVRLLLAAFVAGQFIQVWLWFVAQNILAPNYEWIMQMLQGRYALPALAPLALLVADGWSFLLDRVRLPVVGTIGILAILMLFDTVSFAALVSHYRWPLFQ